MPKETPRPPAGERWKLSGGRWRALGSRGPGASQSVTSPTAKSRATRVPFRGGSGKQDKGRELKTYLGVREQDARLRATC